MEELPIIQKTYDLIKWYLRWSPYLEKYCLLVSVNESYQRAAEDIAVLTGMRVSNSMQQRLVHRQSFEQCLLSSD